MAVDITGAQTLRLIVEPTADGGFNDYADWAGARVTP
ncbi:MAG: NPCBM/NEW2 domain-containing protein [Myxococcales bacterium]|nr:NPCBM/NEW2 domain-containing protein [Myxococcales bacterium]MBK7191545.1 NPCBM/NEW2 domain-containing protein [Myxococcales bacterium]